MFAVLATARRVLLSFMLEYYRRSTVVSTVRFARQFHGISFQNGLHQFYSCDFISNDYSELVIYTKEAPLRQLMQKILMMSCNQNHVAKEGVR